MKTAFVIYTALLCLTGGLAWILGGQGFLLVAAMAGLCVYAALRHGARPLAEGTRLITAGILAVAGPVQYQTGLAPLLLCFMALPYFLAATQALAEVSGTVSAREGPGMRSMVFTIAFYTSMGLVLLLARGLEPDISRFATHGLAVAVLLAALAAWDLSRIARLRPAEPAAGTFSMRRMVLPAVLLALAAFVFSGPLPLAAGWLCRLSPRWSMDPVEFKNKPPQPPPPPGLAARAAPDAEASRLGLDESSITGEHRLPPRSDLQPTEIPRFLVQPDPAALTVSLLETGPVYLRSHTLNRFRDNKWAAEVSGGVWIEDAADGAEDGVVTFQPAPAGGTVPHEVFAFDADGYTMPTLTGLTAIHLPRVFAVPGEVLQSAARGSIRYRAVSLPVLYQTLPNPTLLQAGDSGDKIHLATADGELGIQLQRLADSIFAKQTIAADRVSALRDFLGNHYQYSTVMRNPNQLGALENFLFDERRGHCDFYATAAALLLRQAGLPTRIGYGFASREADPATGLITFRDRHAHAWTEVFLKGHGWTICDFTPAEHIGQPAGPATPPPPAPQPDLDQFVDAATRNKVPDQVKTPAETTLSKMLLTWFQQQKWLESALKYTPWAVLAGALLFLAFRFFKRTPEDEAALAAAKARADYERQPGYFKEFLRIAAAAGHPKPEGATPLEFFRALHHAGLPVPPLRPLIDYHCSTRYADLPRDGEREQLFGQELKAFEESVLTDAAARPV